MPQLSYVLGGHLQTIKSKKVDNAFFWEAHKYQTTIQKYLLTIELANKCKALF